MAPAGWPCPGRRWGSALRPRRYRVPASASCSRRARTAARFESPGAEFGCSATKRRKSSSARVSSPASSALRPLSSKFCSTAAGTNSSNSARIILGLEVELRGQLNDAGRAGGGQRAESESAAVAAQHGREVNDLPLLVERHAAVEVVKTGMIRGVEHLHP